MRRTLPSTGLLITAVVLLLAFEMRLVALLFERPPKQHSERFYSAREEVDRNPTNENYRRVGELLYEEYHRPVWKDPVAVQYYCELLFAMGLNVFVITRIMRRLGLGRDPIRLKGEHRQS